jgi:hypothetical protein
MNQLTFVRLTAACGVLVCAAAMAQVPANAPHGTTAQCNDGSFDSSPTRDVACKTRQGVKQWWGKATPSEDNPRTDDRGPHEKTVAPVPVPANPSR